MSAADWLAEHGTRLAGLPVAEAAERVRSAGLTPRTIVPGAVVTLEHRPDRVDLTCDDDGVVRAVRAG